MATNITVNFATAELIAQAQATQAANRAAQVEKERLAALEKVGKQAQANANLDDSAVLDDEAVRDAKLPPYGGYPVATAFRPPTSILDPFFRLYVRCSDLVTFNVNQDIVFQEPAYGITFGTPPNNTGAPGGSFKRKTEKLFDVFTLPLNKDTFVWCYFIREAFLEYTEEYNTPVPNSNTTTPGPSGQTTKGACMLVGPKSARDIPMPSLLYNRLVELNPPFDIDVVPSLVSESSFSNYGISSLNTGFTSVASAPQSQLYFDDPLRKFYTPGIYDYILQTNTSQPFAPQVTLKACGLANTCLYNPEGVLTSYGFDATRNPDVAVPVYRPFPPRVKLFEENVPFSWVENFEERPPETFLSNTFALNQNVFGAWDWGKPGYCRSQLLALGFTEADLTPVTP